MKLIAFKIPQFLLPILILLCGDGSGLYGQVVKYTDSLIQHYTYEVGIRPLSNKALLNGMLKRGEKQQDSSLIFQSLYLLAETQESLWLFDSASYYLNRAQPFTGNLLYQYYWQKGQADISLQTGDFKNSQLHLDTAYQFATELDDTSKIATILLLKSTVFGNLGAFEKSISSIDQASELFQKSKNEKGLQSLYAYMAHYYDFIGEPEKSKLELNKALEQAINQNDTISILFTRQNLLSLYALSDLDLAQQQFIELQKISNQLEYPISPKAQLNYAIALINNSQFAKGEELLESSLNYFIQRNDYRRQVFIYHWTAIAHRGLNQYDLAAEASKKGYTIAQEKGLEKLAQISSYTLYQTYSWRDQHKEGLEWYLKSAEHKDSIYFRSLRKEMVALETKYETFRKEQEIEVLKAKEEMARSKLMLLILGLIFSIITGSLIIMNIITKRKKDRTLHEKEKEVQRIKQKNISQQIDFKQRDLVTKTLQLAKKNQFLFELESEVGNLTKALGTTESETTRRINEMIQADPFSQEDWKQFVKEFEAANSEFILKMNNTFGHFTPSELRLIALMRMNLSSKEIAGILRISDQSVWKSRYRLRKKMGLDAETDLQQMILSL